EAIALAVVRPLVLLHGGVLVAVDRNVRESDLLARRRAAGPGDTGDAETDLRTESLARTASQCPSHDRRHGAVAVDEIGGDVGKDGLRFVRVHHRAALEVFARTAVRREDRREETAGAGLGRRDS